MQRTDRPFPSFDLENGTPKGYLSIGDRLVATVGVSTKHIHGDHLRSVVLVTDAAGKIDAPPVDYLPYGLPRGALPLSRGFHQKEFNAHAGVYDFGQRFYDPVIAQFLSSDSWFDDTDRFFRSGDGREQGPAFAENTATPNLYAYGYRNPVRYRELDGARPVPAELEEPPPQTSAPPAPSEYIFSFGYNLSGSLGTGGAVGSGFVVAVNIENGDILFGGYTSLTVQRGAEIGAAPGLELSFGRGSYENDFLGKSFFASATAGPLTVGYTPGYEGVAIGISTPSKLGVSGGLTEVFSTGSFRLSDIQRGLEQWIWSQTITTPMP